jgi:hypothetical protein
MLCLAGGSLILYHSCIEAQTPLGSLVGTVRDAVGGVIPTAVVTVTDENRGVTRTVTTNTSGDYVVDVLPQGSYMVACEVPGFKKFIQSQIPLRDRETLRIEDVRKIVEI